MAAGLTLDLLANVVMQEKSLGALCKISCVSKHWHNAASLAMRRSTFRSLSLCVDADEPFTPLSRLVGLEELEVTGSGVSEILCQVPSLACCSSLTTLSVEGVSGGVVEAGISACKRLRALGLRSCAIGNRLVISLASTLCRSLRSLDVSKTEVGDDGVMMVALMVDLRDLSLRECRISDVSLDSLAQTARNLEVLDLSRCKGSVTDTGIRSLCSGCGKLRWLVLSWCGEVTLDCIRDTQLDISVPRPFWHVRDGVLSSLCSSESAMSLTALRLVGCNISDLGVESLAECLPALTSLDLTGTRVSDRGVSAISVGCPDLRVLRLNSCSSVGDSGFCFIASRLSCLAELDIKVTDSGLSQGMSKSKHSLRLHVLSLAHCGGVSPEGLTRSISASGGCGTFLQVLNAAGLVVTRAVVQMCASLPLLRWLNVTDCLMVQDLSERSEHGRQSNSEQVPSYEYASVILKIPALRMEGKHALKPRRAPTSSLPRVRSGFQSLETLHTDRCAGLSCFLRLISDLGAPVLRRVTLSGPEVLAADVLVLAQSCRELQEVSLRKCEIDSSTSKMLSQRGILVNS